MPTTRHLINRQRRLATAARTASTTPVPATRPAPPRPPAGTSRRVTAGTARPGVRLPAVLCALTVLLGCFAALAGARASGLRDEPAAHNAALTDIARTSEVTGQITKAVEAVFSYTFARPQALDQAVKAHLTGKAVEQQAAMLAAVRQQGPKQKLVLTTTVTRSGVELIDGDRARVLVFADQSNTRTATKDETTYGAAMLAVDAVRTGGTWRIAALDTLGAGS
ncbi:hypothetical protein [Streptomyces sp. NBC_00829]|uniref:hypothetical protein n=1 Tax=Streptomyces sp. NBC_00829 TaxID=2903679 RepID=UPI00386D6DB4|nr:hypothetical protein OG293_04605 [Streptomyces sp. NBC_00829]